MTGERVLVVSGGNEMFAYRTAVCLADDGFGVVVATPKRSSSLRFSRYVSGTTRLSMDRCGPDHESVAIALAGAVEKHRADVVFPADLVALSACRAAAAHLSVPIVATPSPEVVDVCHDKGRFAQLLDRIGCPQPAQPVVIGSLDEINVITFDRPMIAKPVDGDGGIGVARVDSADELRRHLNSRLPGTGLPLLVQEFIPGSDIDCSFYAEGGLLLTWAVQTRESLADPLIDFVIDDRVVELCKVVVSALGYEGLGHADLRIDERDGSVRFIELNPRVWGSVHYANFLGANFPAFAVRRAMGQQGNPSDPPVGPCRDPDLQAVQAVKALVGRPITAPANLRDAEKRMFVSKHEDSMPLAFMNVRSLVWKRWQRAKSRVTGSTST